MTLAVYRQRREMVRMDLSTCIQAATTEDDVDLLMKIAVPTGKPVLIGMDQQQTIVKLYDHAITVQDLQRMQRSGAAVPDAIPMEKFQVELHVRMDGVFVLKLMLASQESGNLKNRFQELINNGPLFRGELFNRISDAIRSQEGELIFNFADRHGLGEFIKPGEALWQFLDVPFL